MPTETQSSRQILHVRRDLRPKSHLHRRRQTHGAALSRQSGELPARHNLSDSFSPSVSIAARACVPVSYSPRHLRESSHFLGKDNIDDR